jgi:alpha-glucosidase
MPRCSLLKGACFLASLLAVTHGQDATTSTDGVARPIFTIPASADEGANVLPNILDPQAVNAQDVCPGYRASNARYSDRGVSATLTLAGAACVSSQDTVEVF